jgi:hypothetical protein
VQALEGNLSQEKLFHISLAISVAGKWYGYMSPKNSCSYADIAAENIVQHSTSFSITDNLSGI